MSWASTPTTSFVVTPHDYRRDLEAAGFEVVKERNRREFAREFFRQVKARIAEMGGPPPLGIPAALNSGELSRGSAA